MPRESFEDKTKRASECVKLLKKQYPKAATSLSHRSVYQLLVATILSAQCTDERVNMVTPGLFKKYPSIKAFAEAELKELAQDIYATGFFNSKAKSIKTSAQQIIERHGGKVPKTLNELVKLQGVGRKTASVVLGAGFAILTGSLFKVTAELGAMSALTIVLAFLVDFLFFAAHLDQYRSVPEGCPRCGG